jgi:hypothetical protein
MDFEQILIRLGVDAKAAMMGMTSFKSWAKGWATDFASTLKHHLGGTLGAGAALFGLERLFDSFKERALMVSRLSRETGLSTNAVQGIQSALKASGESAEEAAKPLGKFVALVGQAKMGMTDAREKLVTWGLATKAENWNTLNTAKALQRLGEQFDKLGDHESRAALLQQIFGKSWQQMTPLLEQGAAAMEKLDKGNFFTKLTPGAIGGFSEGWSGLRRIGQGLYSGLGNIIGTAIGIPARLSEEIGRSTVEKQLHGNTVIEKTKDALSTARYIWFGINKESDKHNESLEKQGKLLSENLKIQQLQNEAANLQNQIGDRHRFTVGQLADRARELMGNKQALGLAGVYTVTGPMAQAVRIQTLESRAEQAAAYGQTGTSERLYSTADKLRLQSGFLKSTEQDPTKILRDHLDIVKKQLDLMKGNGGAVEVHVKSIASGVGHDE